MYVYMCMHASMYACIHNPNPNLCMYACMQNPNPNFCMYVCVYVYA